MCEATVLIVDDEEANIDILMEILGEDFDVSVAMDGESALEVVAEEAPDLILLDVVMPDMDGHEVCRQLKGSPKTAPIPVIFATGLDNPEEREKGLSLGAVDYLTKPFNPQQVITSVQTHLAKAGSE